LENIIVKINSLKNLDTEDVVHVFMGKDDYRKSISDEMSPNRSMGTTVHDFQDDDPWYELVRVKVKNLNMLMGKLKEFLIPEGTLLRFHLLGLKKNIEIHNHIEMQCPFCEIKSAELTVSRVESLSPLNALGACPLCEGHGMRLIYDREKLVKDPTKSIREGAINFLSFSRFEHMFPAFLKECKKIGLNIDIPFQDLAESKWDFLYEEAGKYEGFNSYFEYLKTLRYKKNIRIYTRSMQREIICAECDGTRVSKKAGSLTIVIGKEIISYKDFLKLNTYDSLIMLKKIMINLKKNIIDGKMGNTFNKLDRL
ncbi:MAG: hypothetical protein Q7U04_00230, partial [Bacteriovorax sp.]|nr:hypothetical protein [Bacteriovorax sp.]